MSTPYVLKYKWLENLYSSYSELVSQGLLKNQFFSYLKNNYTAKNKITKVNLTDINELIKNFEFYSNSDSINSILDWKRDYGYLIIDKYDENLNNTYYVFKLLSRTEYSKKYWELPEPTIFWWLLSPEDYISFEKLTKECKKFALLRLNSSWFMAFLDWWSWYCPVEYYLKWKSDILLTITWNEIYKNSGNYLKWPYNNLNKVIEEDVNSQKFNKQLWIKMVSFSNKEKFGSRVFEGLRALMEDDSWKKMSDLDGIIENADTLKEYIAYLYILFDDFIEEYKKIANLSSIEDTGRTKKLLRDIILWKIKK